MSDDIANGLMIIGIILFLAALAAYEEGHWGNPRRGALPPQDENVGRTGSWFEKPVPPPSWRDVVAGLFEGVHAAITWGLVLLAVALTITLLIVVIWILVAIFTHLGALA